MLKVLVKKQLMEIFRSYFYNAKKNKAYSKGATAAYVVLFVMLMVGVLGGIFTGMALMICKPMAEAEVLFCPHGIDSHTAWSIRKCI